MLPSNVATRTVGAPVTVNRRSSRTISLCESSVAMQPWQKVQVKTTVPARAIRLISRHRRKTLEPGSTRFSRVLLGSTRFVLGGSGAREASDLRAAARLRPRHEKRYDRLPAAA